MIWTSSQNLRFTNVLIEVSSVLNSRQPKDPSRLPGRQMGRSGNDNDLTYPPHSFLLLLSEKESLSLALDHGHCEEQKT